ncbi:MAG: class I SAM-dependent methyltransferase [Candidatus Methanomethylophilaceae archaeon]
MEESLYHNFRRPQGGQGMEVLKSMNEHHSQLTDWALSHLGGLEPSRILDIGCGGGMALFKMATLYPSSMLDGIDFSSESVRFSIGTNSESLRSGRMSIQEGSVSDLPFPDGSFDLITAFETYFFWPDLRSDLRETVRVLAPGGALLIVSEAYPHPDFQEQNDENARLCGLRLVENEEMLSLLRGYGLVPTAYTREEMNWVAFLAWKKE